MSHRFSIGLTALFCVTTIGLAIQPGESQELDLTPAAATADRLAPSATGIKLGETQTNRPRQSDTIAKIHTHQLAGKPAATLYVRNLPILTFLNDESATQNVPTSNFDVMHGNAKVGTQAAGMPDQNAAQAIQNFKAGSTDKAASADSMTRAAQIAAKLNQMYRDGVAADKIQVVWQPNKTAKVGQYVVQVDNLPIAAIDAATTYAETTRNAEQDALLVANRLRRLLGDANPIKSVKGKPVAVATAIVPTETAPVSRSTQSEWSVRKVIRGDASWYGPGFDGNLTASGETFNQQALTAAHPSLAFGTRIRVTNQYNGRSVIVRVNDRGPYAGGRILDLSAGAARKIGLDASGVAPVTLEILQRNSAIAVGS